MKKDGTIVRRRQFRPANTAASGATEAKNGSALPEEFRNEDS